MGGPRWPKSCGLYFKGAVEIILAVELWEFGIRAMAVKRKKLFMAEYSKDSPETTFADLLQKAADEASQTLKTKIKKVRFIVPASMVAEQNIVLPYLARKDLDRAVKRSAQKWLGEDAPVILRYQAKRGAEGTQVFMVAIHSKTLEEYMLLAQESNLKIAGIVPVVACLLPYCRPDGALLYAGYDGLIVGIARRDGFPVWTGSEPVEGVIDPSLPAGNLLEAARSSGNVSWADSLIVGGGMDNVDVTTVLRAKGWNPVPVVLPPDVPDSSWMNLYAAAKRRLSGELDFSYIAGSRDAYIKKWVTVLLLVVMGLEGYATYWWLQQEQKELSRAEAYVNLAQKTSTSQQTAVIQEIKTLKGELDKKKAEPVLPPVMRWDEVFSALQKRARGVELAKVNLVTENQEGLKQPTKSTNINKSPNEKTNTNKKIFRITGKAPDLGSLFRFARSLEDKPFSRVFIENIQVGEKGSLSFSLVVGWND